MPITVDLLIGYFDAMFYTLWQFRFMYANLADILSRDEALKKRYLHAQQQVLNRSSDVLRKLKKDGILEVDDARIVDLADTIKMMVSFWISYQLTQTSISTITKATLYDGLLRVMMIFKAYSTPSSIASESAASTSTSSSVKTISGSFLEPNRPFIFSIRVGLATNSSSVDKDSASDTDSC